MVGCQVEEGEKHVKLVCLFHFFLCVMHDLLCYLLTLNLKLNFLERGREEEEEEMIALVAIWS